MQLEAGFKVAKASVAVCFSKSNSSVCIYQGLYPVAMLLLSAILATLH